MERTNERELTFDASSLFSFHRPNGSLTLFVRLSTFLFSISNSILSTRRADRFSLLDLISGFKRTPNLDFETSSPPDPNSNSSSLEPKPPKREMENPPLPISSGQVLPKNDENPLCTRTRFKPPSSRSDPPPSPTPTPKLDSLKLGRPSIESWTSTFTSGRSRTRRSRRP